MHTPALVTGGCGFVGRHLVPKLLKRGIPVWIIDDLSIGKHPDTWLLGFTKEEKGGVLTYQKGNQEVHFVKGDVIDVFFDEVKKRGGVALPAFGDIFHLASIVGGRTLIDGDPLLVATDLAIDATFFLWATRRKEKVGRILYASSSAAYPVHLQSKERVVTLKEHHIDFGENLGQPDMTYGWSKLSGEYLSRLAAERYGLHVARVRPFSGYGEDQDTSYPVPAIAARVARREDPIVVWGTGEQSRDFVHIDDCIDAMFVVLDNVRDGRGVNISTGKLTTFNQVIATLARIEGYSPKIKPLTEKPVGVHARHADPSMLHGFGFKPAISLEEGMRRVLLHAKNNPRIA